MRGFWLKSRSRASRKFWVGLINPHQQNSSLGWLGFPRMRDVEVFCFSESPNWFGFTSVMTSIRYGTFPACFKFIQTCWNDHKNPEFLSQSVWVWTQILEMLDSLARGCYQLPQWLYHPLFQMDSDIHWSILYTGTSILYGLHDSVNSGWVIDEKTGIIWELWILTDPWIISCITIHNDNRCFQWIHFSDASLGKTGSRELLAITRVIVSLTLLI